MEYKSLVVPCCCSLWMKNKTASLLRIVIERVEREQTWAVGRLERFVVVEKRSGFFLYKNERAQVVSEVVNELVFEGVSWNMYQLIEKSFLPSQKSGRSPENSVSLILISFEERGNRCISLILLHYYFLFNFFANSMSCSQFSYWNGPGSFLTSFQNEYNIDLI